MNNLYRNIEPHEIVILKTNFADGDPHARAFVCLNGSGMSEVFPASDITGYWLDNKQPYLISGDWIDVRDTVMFHKHVGRFDPSDKAPSASKHPDPTASQE